MFMLFRQMVPEVLNLFQTARSSAIQFLIALKKTSRMHPNQWEFQDPKLKVPTIYKAYIRPM